jgi:hypothetical protein
MKTPEPAKPPKKDFRLAPAIGAGVLTLVTGIHLTIDYQP